MLLLHFLSTHVPNDDHQCKTCSAFTEPAFMQQQLTFAVIEIDRNFGLNLDAGVWTTGTTFESKRKRERERQRELQISESDRPTDPSLVIISRNVRNNFRLANHSSLNMNLSLSLFRDIKLIPLTHPLPSCSVILILRTINAPYPATDVNLFYCVLV
jgi:hypothetical protein